MLDYLCGILATAVFLGLVATFHMLVRVRTVRQDHAKILGAPRLTVEELACLEQPPNHLILTGKTSALVVRAPLSDEECAWYKVVAGHLDTVGSNEGEQLYAKYTKTSGSDDIALVGTGDGSTTVWLSPELAQKPLVKGAIPLTHTTVFERTPYVTNSPVSAPMLNKLRADGHIKAIQQRPNPDSKAALVTETVAHASAQALVLGRARRSNKGVVIDVCAGALHGVSCLDDAALQQLLDRRLNLWKQTRKWVAGATALALGLLAIAIYTTTRLQ